MNLTLKTLIFFLIAQSSFSAGEGLNIAVHIMSHHIGNPLTHSDISIVANQKPSQKKDTKNMPGAHHSHRVCCHDSMYRSSMPIDQYLPSEWRHLSPTGNERSHLSGFRFGVFRPPIV